MPSTTRLSHKLPRQKGTGVEQSTRESYFMKKAYDFSKGRRGAVIPATGKTRITIYIDDAILARFKTQSEKTGKGYQALINVR